MGDSFQVDGRDYDHVTQALSVPSTAQVGISVPTAALEAAVEGTLSAAQHDNVIGAEGTAAQPSVAVRPMLPSTTIAAIAEALCQAAPLANQRTTPLNGSLAVTGTTTYGTRAAPQIHCITAVGIPGTMSVDINGNFSGAGVLIVRGADLVARGNFHYEGLIIVTGPKVGFGMLGTGQQSQEVYGSVMINETGLDGSSYKELALHGAARIRYSQSALDFARRRFPTTDLVNFIAGLPASVRQLSWMEVYN
jgi:hypothetical protein